MWKVRGKKTRIHEKGDEVNEYPEKLVMRKVEVCGKYRIVNENE